MHLNKAKCWSKKLRLPMYLLRQPLQFKNSPKVGCFCLYSAVVLGNLPHQIWPTFMRMWSGIPICFLKLAFVYNVWVLQNTRLHHYNLMYVVGYDQAQSQAKWVWSVWHKCRDICPSSTSEQVLWWRHCFCDKEAPALWMDSVIPNHRLISRVTAQARSTAHSQS